jgi:hypothetical protein
MPLLNCIIPASLLAALTRSTGDNKGASDIVTRARPVLVGIHVDDRDNRKLFEQVNERSIH